MGERYPNLNRSRSPAPATPGAPGWRFCWGCCGAVTHNLNYGKFLLRCLTVSGPVLLGF